MNEIGNQEQARCVLRKPGLHVRVQLKQGVEDEELNARPVEDLFTRDSLKYFLHRTLRSFVAVTDRILAEPSLGIDQSIVGAPAIDTNARDGPTHLPSRFTRLTHPFFDVGKDPRTVPSKMPVAVNWGILEAMDLF